MKLNKNTYDSLIIDNMDTDKSIDKAIPNPEDCFEEHCMINDPYYALNYFRKIIVACFNNDYEVLNQAKEKNEYEYEATFKALEALRLLKSIHFRKEKQNEYGIHMTFTHRNSAVLTNKGIRYYNDICNETIWNKALNAFKKNEIEPRFPSVVELCGYLNK